MKNYYIQIIDPNGGEYGIEKTPVSVNRRYEVVGHALPDQWHSKLPFSLFEHVYSQPRNTQGVFEGFEWIKE